MTDGGVATAAPTVAVWPSPASTASRAGGPGSAVARNTARVSAAPVTLSTARASTRWLSAGLVPMVHRSCAMPFTFVRLAPANTLPPAASDPKVHDLLDH